ncbi:unnamed protein product [Mucor fragilis]
MERSWNYLPQELLHIIFKSPAVTTQILLELNHVSKNWSQAANKVLYYEIDLNEQNIGQFLYTMNILGSRCGSYVRVARLTEGVALTKSHVNGVIRICTNLTQLWMSHVHDDYYQQLQYMYEEEGRLQHFEDGTAPGDFDNDKIFHDYSRAMVAMKENMVSLLLEDRQYQTPSHEYTAKDFDYLAHHLDQFPRLRRLAIRTQAPTYLYENDYLIQKCSHNLVTVSIATHNAQMLTSPVTRPSLDMDSVQKRPLVKNLMVYTDVLTTTDMEYIMHAYPNTQHFGCHSPDLQRSFHWEDFSENGVYSSETCVRFIDFAAQVRSLELLQLPFPVNALEPVLLSIAKRPEVKALNVCGGLFYGVEHASLNLVSAEDSFLYELTERNIKSWNTQLFLRMRDIKEPYRNLLNIFGGDNIEHLTLDMDVFSHDFTQSAIGINHMQTFGNSFGQVLDNFLNLKEIYLKNTIIESFSRERKSRHHLKTLSIEATGLNVLIPTRISQHISKIDHFILHEINMLGGSPQHDDDDDDNDDDDERRITLRFPETAFDTVEFLDAFASDTGCLVCITFGYEDEKVQSLNYLIKEDSMQRITRDQREDLFINTGMYQVDLSCASIKRFGVHSYEMDAQPLFIYFDD